jgi:pyruvate dehydrogenase E1 component alpha subunit
MELQRGQTTSVSLSKGESEILRVIGPDGRADPATDPKLDLSFVHRVYEMMVLYRLVDERMTALQRQGRVGFHVGGSGEEASIVASAAALRPQDWIFSCYREVAAALWRGFELQSYIDNMYGNANDVIEGRQMPDHITAKSAHFASVSSIIGTQITNAVGFAWAAKYRKEDSVTAVYFGDGATSANDFHGGMTFAGVFKLPVVFLLRNNQWAISVPLSRQTAASKLSDKALGYGIPALRCDGNDALAVYAAVHKAVSRAAAGGGATLVEMVTYRLGAHTTSDDPTVYRSEAEVEEHRRHDPVKRLRRYLEVQNAWSQSQDDAFVSQVKSELQTCIERAEKAPKPALSTIFDKVYEKQPLHLIEQQTECEEGPRARLHK